MIATLPFAPARRALAAAQAAWIPPVALVAGQLAHGASWLLLGLLAWNGVAGASPMALAWVHLVALGWLTTVSLAVLMHVIPGVLDVDWRGERIARGAIAPFWLASLALAAGFWCGRPDWLVAAAVVLVASLAVYLGLAARTLADFKPDADTSMAVMRAFVTVFIALGLTALVGCAMALALGGLLGPAWLNGLPALHAHLGAVGWLSLLVLGVATRTVKRITGAGPKNKVLHIVSATLLLAALVALAVGVLTTGGLWLPAAALLGVVGAGCHAAELAIAVRRATVPHRVPHAFIAAAGVYLVLTAILGVGVALGQIAWQPAYVYLALAGWLGQMVNGHLHHIGLRLIATLARGDEDETPPGLLLAPGLSWTAFIACQAAVVGGAIALLAANPAWLGIAAAWGFVGWAVTLANVRHAWTRARALP